MRNQSWNSQGQLIQDLEVFRDAQGNARVKDWLTGQEQAATPEEDATLKTEERYTKKEQARQRAIAAIKANQTGAPWGQIFYDLVVAQGLIEEQ